MFTPTLVDMSNHQSQYVRGKLERTVAAGHGLETDNEKRFEQLAQYAQLPEGARVLDVACGTGSWASTLARHGLRVHCTDLQREFLEVAAETSRREGVFVTPVQADAVALPYRDGVFDAVTVLSVLEHVPDWTRLLSESLRVIRPGGTLWVTSTNQLCPWTDEISGFPMFPWYPANLKTRVLEWVKVHRPDLVGHSPTPAIHWFTHDALQAHFEGLGCVDVATFVDHVRPKERTWKRVVVEALRASSLLRDLFWVVHPCVSLMVRKAPPRAHPHSIPNDHPSGTQSVGDLMAELNETAACPRCTGALTVEGRTELRCMLCRLSYFVRDGIPQLLDAEARPLPAALG
jgi:2-polyprenyl-3-methyl-5-hydroxy-6-metoxy-1,4-benzoquinol methylase/uncharacterized protein YbaR (Trm112 family)